MAALPGGGWQGYWLQRTRPGRRYMWLSISVSDAGDLFGEGWDDVGRFAVRGQCPPLAVHPSAEEAQQKPTADQAFSFLKLYREEEGAHAVRYTGTMRGDGREWEGVWRLHAQTGRFILWPAAGEEGGWPTRHEGKKWATKTSPIPSKAGGSR